VLLGGAFGETRNTSTPGVSNRSWDETRRKALRSHVRTVLKSRCVATASISRSTVPLPVGALKKGGGCGSEENPALRVGLEPSSDVPRDQHECQRTGIPG
jgi:hypothetical protein